MLRGTVNIEALENALGAIKLYPELHFQGDWRCKSGMCLAGQMVDQSGVQWAFRLDPSKPEIDSELTALVVATDDLDAHGVRALRDVDEFRWAMTEDDKSLGELITSLLSPGVTPDTLVEGVETYAVRLAGLNSQQASLLFYGGNTAEDLEVGVKALANGQGLIRNTLTMRLVAAD